MQIQLDELRLEESAVLFTDTALAIGSIANTILPLLMSDNDHELIQPIADMRESIAMLIDAYEQQNITVLNGVLNGVRPCDLRFQYNALHGYPD